MLVGSIAIDPVFLVKENIKSAVMAAVEVPEVHVPELEVTMGDLLGESDQYGEHFVAVNNLK